MESAFLVFILSYVPSESCFNEDDERVGLETTFLMNVLPIPEHSRTSPRWDSPVFGTLECLTGALTCDKELGPNLTSDE